MSDRISIKGKGASIFFGEEEGTEHHPEQPVTQPVNDLARSDPGSGASRHPGATAPRIEPANEPTKEPISDAGARRGSSIPTSGPSSNRSCCQDL